MSSIPQFKCDCKTSKVAQQFLQGAVDRETLRRAVQHHVNHACPDFMTAHNLLFKKAETNGKTRQ